MSYTDRAVGRERTTIIMEYINLRPQWSSNIDLTLRWDVCDQVLDEMKNKCYGADERPARRSDRLTLTVFEEITRRPAQTARNMEFIGSIRSNRIKLEQIMSLDYAGMCEVEPT